MDTMNLPRLNIVVVGTQFICTLLRVELSREGYTVWEFKGYDEALYALFPTENPAPAYHLNSFENNIVEPDMVFVDLSLPKMDGYEVTRYLRSRLPVIPIVTISGKGGLFVQLRARVAGATQHLHKPIVRAKLIALVEKYAAK